MMRETYGRIFFRKIAFLTPLFFLTLSPYLILVDLLELGSATTVVGIAILTSLLSF